MLICAGEVGILIRTSAYSARGCGFNPIVIHVSGCFLTVHSVVYGVTLRYCEGKVRRGKKLAVLRHNAMPLDGTQLLSRIFPNTCL